MSTENKDSGGAAPTAPQPENLPAAPQPTNIPEQKIQQIPPQPEAVPIEAQPEIKKLIPEEPQPLQEIKPETKKIELNKEGTIQGALEVLKNNENDIFDNIKENLIEQKFILSKEMPVFAIKLGKVINTDLQYLATFIENRIKPMPENIEFKEIIENTKKFLEEDLSAKTAIPNDRSGLSRFKEIFNENNEDLKQIFSKVSDDQKTLKNKDHIREFTLKAFEISKLRFGTAEGSGISEIVEAVVDIITKIEGDSFAMDFEAVINYIDSYISGTDEIIITAGPETQTPMNEKADKKQEDEILKTEKINKDEKPEIKNQEKIQIKQEEKPEIKKLEENMLLMNNIEESSIKNQPDLYKNSQSSIKPEDELINELKSTISQYEILLKTQISQGKDTTATRDLIALLNQQMNDYLHNPKPIIKPQDPSPENQPEIINQNIGFNFSNMEKLLTKEESMQQGIREIFYFYCRQQYLVGKRPTFDQMGKIACIMNIGEFMKFCLDFKVPIKPVRIKELFKRKAISGKELDFDHFIVFFYE